jgi:hypothetical protein
VLPSSVVYFSTERVGAVPVLILCSQTKRLSELASSITSRGLTATAVGCASTVESVYHWLVRRVLKHDGYFVTYFHPWEFYDLKEHPEFKMPFIIKNHSGREMAGRLDKLIKMLKAHGHEFITYTEFTDKQL